MKRLKLVILILLVLLLLPACSTNNLPVEEVAEVEPTAIAQLVEPTVTLPPATAVATETAPVPTTTISPTAIPATSEPPPQPTETPVVLVLDNCQACHSDQALLTNTADPVEEKESAESSGVG